MHWNRWIRQVHRWLSILFVAIVAAIFILMGIGKPPSQWVFFLPLFPLALLAATGLYLFVLPYTRRGRGGARGQE